MAESKPGAVSECFVMPAERRERPGRQQDRWKRHPPRGPDGSLDASVASYALYKQLRTLQFITYHRNRLDEDFGYDNHTMEFARTEISTSSDDSWSPDPRGYEFVASCLPARTASHLRHFLAMSSHRERWSTRTSTVLLRIFAIMPGSCGDANSKDSQRVSNVDVEP